MLLTVILSLPLFLLYQLHLTFYISLPTYPYLPSIMPDLPQTHPEGMFFSLAAALRLPRFGSGVFIIQLRRTLTAWNTLR